MDIDTRTCSEDDALRAWGELRRRFSWAGTFYNRRDVAVVRGEDDFVITDPETEITDAEWSVVRDRTEWKDGIVDQMVDELELPQIVRYEDGTFAVSWPYESSPYRYTADGRCIGEVPA